MPATGYFDPNYYGVEANQRGQNAPAMDQSYADILNANTAARTQQITTPGGQTLATSDPNFSQAGDFQQMMSDLPFRTPTQMQDWANSAGVPFDSSAYAKRYNDYTASQHPNLQGVGGWMHNHPVGTIAAFIAAAAGGAALSGGLGGGAAGGGGAEGGGAVGGGGGVGGEVGGGSLGGWGGGTQSGLGVFANGGTGGLAGVGGGNAGALAAAGGIQGGAGTGILGSIGGAGGLLSSNGLLGRNASSLGGLFGGGNSGSQTPQQVPINIPSFGGMLGSQTQQPQSSPTFVGLPIQQQQPYIPAHGYNAHDFYGAKVWT